MKIIPALVTSLVLCCLIAAPAHADSVPSCVPETSIASLQQSGGCESGGLLYSNFQYNNSGLQISPGVYATPSNVLVTATPFSLTFSTDYGIDGGFTNCLYPAPYPAQTCIEEEGSIGYDVSALPRSGELAGLALVGGFSLGIFGGELTEIACLGTGNDANVFTGASSGLGPVDIPRACPENPDSSVLLTPLTPFGGSPIGLFPPVSTISVSMGLFVEPDQNELLPNGTLLASGPSNLPPFSNVFLRVPEPSSLMLLGTGLLALAIIKLRRPIG